MLAALGDKRFSPVLDALQVASGFEAADMRLYANVCYRRLGELIGGDEGAALGARTGALMNGQRIIDHARTLAMCAPGFPQAMMSTG